MGIQIQELQHDHVEPDPRNPRQTVDEQHCHHRRENIRG